MGLSVIVPPGVASIEAELSWGDYAPDVPEIEAVIAGDTDRAAARGAWRRAPRSAALAVPTRQLVWEQELPAHPGVWVVATSRPVHGVEEVTEGARALAVFVVNRRSPLGDMVKDKAWMFQVRLRLTTARSFEPRPDVRDRASEDADEAVADLQYRDEFEYAVGHNVSAHATATEHGCADVETTWIPHARVEKVIPRDLPSVELSMERLATLTTAAEVHAALAPLADEYGAWIAMEEGTLLPDPRHVELVAHLMTRAGVACRRIRDGIACLAEDPLALDAFRTANRAIALAVRQRDAHEGAESRRYVGDKAPKWYPFQLAFVLMNVRGIVHPDDDSRACVDLLFFPTGGGKTEAYLGLAAFTMVPRRLRNPGRSGGGVSVMMRYTLRLLTLDQLGRAATLVCVPGLPPSLDITGVSRPPLLCSSPPGVNALARRDPVFARGDGGHLSAQRESVIASPGPPRERMPKPKPPPAVVLSGLLGALFTPNELRNFLREHHPAVLGALAQPASPDTLAAETADALLRHGRADAALFDALIHARPGRKADIEAARAECAPSPRARRRAAAPAPAAPPPPAASAPDLAALETSGVLLALAECFSDPLSAQLLLHRAGVPAHAVPAMGNLIPLDHWRAVLRALDRGIVPGATARILALAAKDYRGNPAFAPYR